MAVWPIEGGSVIMPAMTDDTNRDPPPQPPRLPLHVVRPVDPELLHLRRENARLVARNFEIERERESQSNLVELLRQQLKHFSDSKPEEPTAPGLGPLPKPDVTQPAPEPSARGSWGRRHWLLLGSVGLGLAATGAAAAYPPLLAPIRYLQAHLPELLQLLEGVQ